MAFAQRLDLKRFIGVNDLDGSYKARSQTGDPATPEASSLKIYSKQLASVSHLYWEDDAGTVHDVGSAAIGTGAAGQVAIWTGVTTLGGDTDLTFVTDTLTATKIVGATSITTPSLTDSGMTLGSVLFAGTGGLLSQDVTANNQFIYDSTNHDLFLGANTQPVAGFTGRGLHIIRSGSFVELNLYGYGNTGAGAGIRGSIARGTAITPTAAQLNDLFQISFDPYDSGSVEATGPADIKLACGEIQDGTHHGTYISFSTTPLASVTKAEAVRITPAGGLNVGQTANVTLGVIDVLTGYRIGAAAVSGNVLRGNGTNFVSAALALTDVTPRAHSSLTSLVSPADDHTQYLFLAGRSGGQTAIGGTAASNNLLLQSTSNATRGNVVMTDQIKYGTGGNETTGGGTALLGANSPAVTNTAPYKWWKVITSDGSAGYIPVWK